MGYLDFLPFWFMSFAIPPVIALVGAEDPFETFLRMSGLSAAIMLLGFVFGYVSIFGGFVAGIVLAIWGAPLTAIACAIGIVVKRSRDRIDKEERISEYKAAGADAVSNGICPNCDKLIALSFSECPHCHALFGEAGWKIEPLR